MKYLQTITVLSSSGEKKTKQTYLFGFRFYRLRFRLIREAVLSGLGGSAEGKVGFGRRDYVPVHVLRWWLYTMSYDIEFRSAHFRDWTLAVR